MRVMRRRLDTQNLHRVEQSDEAWQLDLTSASRPASRAKAVIIPLIET
jgi:hypothetical protein